MTYISRLALIARAESMAAALESSHAHSTHLYSLLKNAWTERDTALADADSSDRIVAGYEADLDFAREEFSKMLGMAPDQASPSLRECVGRIRIKLGMNQLTPAEQELKL